MSICRRKFGLSLVAAATSRWLPALPPRPKLLVMVIVEQFRPEYLSAARPQFSAGGLRRLLDKGAFFPDCRHYASTFPSTTIATLATGAWPSQHGIVADRWYDRSIQATVSASNEELLATTLAAQIAAEPRARVWVIGMNQSHAGLLAGVSDAHLFWMNEECDFVASGDAPEWLAAFNGQKPAESTRNKEWKAVGAKPDAPPLRTLSYDPQHPAEYLTLFRSSPFSQNAQFELLSELITREKLGQGNTVDFVCLLAQSTAMLGYEQGGRSPLMREMTLHLDRKLETLLTQLSKTPGENAFSLVLAGAHGAPPVPSEDTRQRMAVSGENIAQQVDKSLASAGIGRVEKYLYPFLYIDPRGSRDPEPIRMLAARSALQHPAIDGYYTAGGACSTHNEWEQRFRNSFHAERSGDVMFSYRAEYVEDYGQGRGVSYGSLYNYDLRTPLCFFGPQFKAGNYEHVVEPVDVAPTLARILGVPAPSSGTGRVLGEALAE
jgi:type I phosphodiesterase/nucleotide pyrophosphatase